MKPDLIEQARKLVHALHTRRAATNDDVHGNFVSEEAFRLRQAEAKASRRFLRRLGVA